MKHLTYIEPLEDRIAPATIVNPYTVTFQDGNGDTAVIKISKPLFKNATAAGNILTFVDNSNNAITTANAFNGNGTQQNLFEIDLLGRTDAQDMNISVKVLSQVGFGDTQVNVGEIMAASVDTQHLQFSQNIDLGSVNIQGNLGFIQVGDNFSTPALKSLTALSMSQPAQSYVLGPIVNMDVKGDFNANLQIIGFQYGTIDKLTIGGTLGGDSSGDASTGAIGFTGHIGSVTIGNIVGTAGNNTGELEGDFHSPTSIGSLHVLGSITGGNGAGAGQVFAENGIGKVTVGGSITGGGGVSSGEITGPLGPVSIGGSVTGGPGQQSGSILGQNFTVSGSPISQKIGKVTIGGDLVGGAGQNSGNVAGVLGTVIIQGNLTGGSGTSSGAIFSQATNSAGGLVPTSMNAVVIDGNVTGGTAGTAAVGSSTPAVPGDTGIISALSANSIFIGGSLTGGTPTSSSQSADTSGVVMVDSVGSLAIGAGIFGGGGPNSGLVEGTTGFSPIYGSITVKQGITGGAGATSGAIMVSSVNTLTVGQSLTGSSGTNSGEIFVSTKAGTLHIAGDVTGGSAGVAAAGSSPAVPGDSGFINVGVVKNITVGGSLTGGTPGGASATADTSGVIRVGVATTVSIGKDIVGGGGPTSGMVLGSSGFALIGTVTVGGGITGGAGNLSGGVEANNVTTLAIGKSLTGGSGTNSGVIEGTDTTLPISYGSIAIAGDIVGGSGSDTSGSISLGPHIGGSQTTDPAQLGSLRVGGSVIGGSGFRSAEVFAFTNIGQLSILGDLTGGTGSNSGELITGESITNAVIGGNLTGNQSINSATPVVNSGYIEAGQIVSLEVKGNVTAGFNANTSGGIANSGAIRATQNIVRVTIDGQVIGNAENPVIISAQQAAAEGLVTIGSVTVNGDATYLDVLAGYSSDVNNGATPLGVPTDGSATINTVSIGGNLSASSIVAGVMPDSNGQFGTAGNAAIAAKVFTNASRITSVTVKGTATGNGIPGDSFGIESENLGSVAVNGATLVPPGPAVGSPVLVNGNLFILEVT